MSKRKNSLPFDKAGGTVVMQRRLLNSPAYLSLTPYAKALIHLMHRHWTPANPVGFGVRQAEREIPCSRAVALRTFQELQDAGFIVKEDESLFCSRTQSKTRTWRLTWMPCWRNRPPTNDWDAPAKN